MSSVKSTPGSWSRCCSPASSCGRRASSGAAPLDTWRKRFLSPFLGLRRVLLDRLRDGLVRDGAGCGPRGRPGLVPSALFQGWNMNVVVGPPWPRSSGAPTALSRHAGALRRVVGGSETGSNVLFMKDPTEGGRGSGVFRQAVHDDLRRACRHRRSGLRDHSGQDHQRRGDHRSGQGARKRRSCASTWSSSSC